MTDVSMKIGDRLPFLDRTLSLNGSPVDLTGATVSFRLRYLGSSTVKVSAAATVLDAVNGSVRYVWGANDLDVRGAYEFEFVVTFPGGITQTFPGSGNGILYVEGPGQRYLDTRPEVLQSSNDSVLMPLIENGVAEVPDAASGWVTILDAGGGTKLPRTQTGVTVGRGEIKYTGSWVGYELEEDYVALFEWQVGGIAKSNRLLFDVVRVKLQCPITTDDLVDLYPDIEEHLRSLVEDDGVKFIRSAWRTFLNKIRSGHNRPSLILDRSRIVEPVLELAAAYMCRALSKTPDDIWKSRQSDHQNNYKSSMAGLGEMKYDIDEDGLAANNETKRINRRRFQV